jgi:hypothetical protein
MTEEQLKRSIINLTNDIVNPETRLAIKYLVELSTLNTDKIQELENSEDVRKNQIEKDNNDLAEVFTYPKTGFNKPYKGAWGSTFDAQWGKVEKCLNRGDEWAVNIFKRFKNQDEAQQCFDKIKQIMENL